MLDAEKAGALLRHHFDTVTDEEFIENVRRFNPDFAQEMWGSRTTAEILAQRPVTPRAHHDPETSVTTAVRPFATRRRGVRGLFAALGRLVLKIFSMLGISAFSRSVLRLFS